LYVYVQVRDTLGLTVVSDTVFVSRLPEASYPKDVVRVASVIDVGSVRVWCHVVEIFRWLVAAEGV